MSTSQSIPKKMSRKHWLFTMSLGLIASMVKATEKSPEHGKILWQKLSSEPLRVGDFWASEDPNTPERQAESGYNLQLQAVHPTAYGKPAKEVGIGNGAFWRPVNIIAVS